MTIVALGINHKTAPVELREKVAFSAEQLTVALQQLQQANLVMESVIVSTCNRTEIYCSLEGTDTQTLLSWLAQFHQLPVEQLQDHTYCYVNDRAISHLMRVSCGLDSLVLGEPQILGQIKQAYNDAKHYKSVGVMLERLFQKTFAVAKHVRTETEIGASAVSVAYAAVSLAKHIYGKLDKTNVLLIGAGETIELVARHLHQNGCARMTVANRTVARAENLAKEFSAHVVSLAEVPEQLIKADIVISSTASTLPIIGKGVVEQALKARRYKPMLFIDIAVPRDIESQVGELNDAYLYTVDDLQAIVSENMASREKAADEAEDIIVQRVDEFLLWLKSLDSVDVIKLYREDSEQIKQELLNRAQQQLLAGKAPDKVLLEFANKFSNRMMHAPTKAIKEAAEAGELAELAQLRKILGIEPQ
ncbi:glutamyl-tRNA reductase [Pseudoalteromonas tunicata]|uniref:glutamyl-tRNA reductase n=1 Tax=Pseudoalteromonas tunicata TaxID=314281 RepID=UPI00273F2C61|nr:glutamyl-tRNA reductase [Pseudoalteromonas tunicata]MDP4985187.1 glutamyl-tRNA reductase [Pseudoalteromonas tunicata]